jgi:hypothetical protein
MHPEVGCARTNMYSVGDTAPIWSRLPLSTDGEHRKCFNLVDGALKHAATSLSRELIQWYAITRCVGRMGEKVKERFCDELLSIQLQSSSRNACT